MAISKKQIRPLARLHGFWLRRGFLSQTPRWPLERRRQFVLEKLRQTLVRAHEGIPFYRERFAKVGFDPARHFQRLEDMQVIPPLTKEELRTRGKELVDRRFLGGSVLAHTSGTTGQPTEMRLNEYYIALDYATMFRHWGKVGYHFRARYAALRSYVPERPGAPLWKYNFPQNTLYMSAYHLKPANAREYIEALIRFQPEYLRGYASSLNVLAEYAYADRARFQCLRGIFTASETLLASERATIERTFGRKLLDWYGMTEPAVVITERADHEGMEVEWEYGYPEFIADRSLQENERWLLATSLHNPVMPLIRYDTRDIVRLAGRAETEGERLYPRVEAVLGRKDECLITADGGRLPSLNFYSLLQSYTEILRFQFVQTGLKEVEVRLSWRPGAEVRPAILEGLRSELAKRLGDDFAFKIEITDQFMCSPDGKTPTFKQAFRSDRPTQPAG